MSYRKPSPNAIINPQHPLAQGLIVEWHCGTSNRNLTGLTADVVLTGSPAATTLGGNLALSFNGSSQGARIPSVPFNSTTQFSWMIKAAIAEAWGTHIIFESTTNFNNAQGSVVAVIEAPYLNFYTRNYDGLYNGRYASSGDIDDGVVRTLTGTCDAGLAGATEKTIWKNTVESSIQFLTNEGDTYATNDVYFASRGASSLWLPITAEFFRLYRRALNPTEIAQLHASPYQMFWEPGRRAIFVPMEAGGATGYEESGALTSTSTLTATATVGLVASGAATSTSTITATATVGLTASGAVTSTATIAGTATLGLVASGAATSTITITGSGTVGLVASGTITSTASIGATETSGGGADETGAITSTASIAAVATVGLVGAGAVTSTSTLAGNGVAGLVGSGTLTATATLTGTETLGSSSTETGSLTSVSAIGATATVGLVGSGGLTATATLSATESIADTRVAVRMWHVEPRERVWYAEPRERIWR